MRTVANAGLAVVTVWGGVNLMVSPHIRAPYHGALELVPRVLLSGILVNTSLDWGHFVIDLNNALCQQFGSTSIPAWDSVLQLAAGSALLNLIAMAIYLVMGLLLLGQMLMRLALLDALLVVATAGAAVLGPAADVWLGPPVVQHLLRHGLRAVDPGAGAAARRGPDPAACRRCCRRWAPARSTAAGCGW